MGPFFFLLLLLSSLSLLPSSLIILDKKYADKTVVMVNEQAKDY